MKKNIYQIWCDTSRIPVTVIAESYETAEMLYAKLRRAHGSGNEYELMQVTERDAEWLADHPQLAELAANGLGGIAYWVDHRIGWVLAAPSEEPAGQLQPPEAPVTYYLVEAANGGRFLVFATSPEHALNMYLVMRARSSGDRPRRFTIKTPSRWLLTGEMTVLREEMDAGRMGIAGWSEEDGWHIFPPDDERVVP